MTVESTARVAAPATAARRQSRLTPSRIVIPIIAYAVAIFMAIPIWWMISQSLTPEKDIYVWPLRMFPENPTLDNYRTLFERPDIPMARWYFNSFFIAFATTGLVLLVASLAAYGYARLQFPGRDKLFYALLATLMVPGAVFLIPVFLILRDLRWLDTYLALIVPHASSVYAVFFLRQFFLTIPKELEEAAVLDGCSRFGVYWRIILPLSGSALAALAIFTFLGNWNDFLSPLIFTNHLDMRTLPVGLTILNGEYWSERGLVMAAASLSALPVLIVYAIFQNYIIKGIALTGLKG